MKKAVRNLSVLLMVLILVCTVSTGVLALNEPTTEKSYVYDDIVLTHKIIGYTTKAHAIISFEYTNGNPIPSDYAFSYSGTIDYQYCPEEYQMPRYYEDGQKTASGSTTGSQKIIYTDKVPSGYLMVDASMCFTTQFSTTHSDISHSRPDTIYVLIN